MVAASRAIFDSFSTVLCCTFTLCTLVSQSPTVCVCVCVGQPVKVGLAWSHDITRLRGLSGSQAAPPLTPLPLTSLTPSQSSWGVRLSPSSPTFFVWFQAKTKRVWGAAAVWGWVLDSCGGYIYICVCVVQKQSVCLLCTLHSSPRVRFSYIIELLKNLKLWNIFTFKVQTLVLRLCSWSKLYSLCQTHTHTYTNCFTGSLCMCHVSGWDCGHVFLCVCHRIRTQCENWTMCAGEVWTVCVWLFVCVCVIISKISSLTSTCGDRHTHWAGAHHSSQKIES